MEEDIKVIEEFIDEFRKDNVIVSIKGIRREKEYQAIENLIARNKELEKYKKYAELTKISCCTAQNCEALNNAIKNGLENENLKKQLKDMEKEFIEVCEKLRNSIPKSKAEELLEKLDKEKEKLKGVKSLDRHFTEQMYEAKRNVIKQLLQEGDK